MEKPHEFGEETGVAGLLAEIQHLIGNGGIVDGGRVSAASLLIVRELRLIRQALEAIYDHAEGINSVLGGIEDKMREDEE